jgi:hypothetical protein
MKGMTGCIDTRFLIKREKIMPLFEYEPLILFLKPKTLNEEEDRRDTNGVGPLGTKVAKEPSYVRGGKDSPEREAAK